MNNAYDYLLYNGTEIGKPFTWDYKLNRYPNIDFQSLKSLAIWNYYPESKSFSDIPYSKSLCELEINYANPISLSGLERFEGLSSLQLYYCNKLQTLNGLDIPNQKIKLLALHNAKNITNYEILSYFENIEILRLCNCGCISDISFILKMKYLKSFSFVGTNIVSGDLEPLLLHNPKLEYVGFSNKRHYSHKLKEIRDLLNIP